MYTYKYYINININNQTQEHCTCRTLVLYELFCSFFLMSRRQFLLFFFVLCSVKHYYARYILRNVLFSVFLRFVVSIALRFLLSIRSASNKPMEFAVTNEDTMRLLMCISTFFIYSFDIFCRVHLRGTRCN